MRRCVQLAQLGACSVTPNPMVGAVLVYDGRIIGEGWHQVYGGPHAEVNCFASVAADDIQHISSATLYVSLEPCAHFGKTPPCADKILSMGVKQVVVGTRDPFDSVNGKGIEKLRHGGVEVIENVLDAACRDVNKSFFTFHEQRRPYIILKWAQTSNSMIAAGTTERLLISSKESDVLVHSWRAQVAAILVGTKTALLDDPSLTTRLVNGKSPVRLVIDKKLQIPSSHKLLRDQSKTIVFNELKTELAEPVEYIQVKMGSNLLEQISEYCYTHQLQSLLVEGGAATINECIKANLWDEARVITNSKMEIQAGLAAPTLMNEQLVDSKTIHTDRINFYINKV